MKRASAWLAGAVIYQIYPQSFADSDGDGVGDLRGITSRLEYLSWLGVNTLWLNPCYVSPFGDAGYDVADYRAVAPRYGTNADLVELVRSAHDRGIRVLLDLVPGHTSDQHPWFLASTRDPGDQRYIWSSVDGERFVPSPGPRPGYYLRNFYPIQPALNYGYARLSPAEPHRQPVDAEWPRANRAALREVMAFWLDLGVAGFRVDMASSLVKDDPDRTENALLWGQVRDWLDAAYPEAVVIPEWGDPACSVPAGFHADFFLHFTSRAMPSLWDNATGVVIERLSHGGCFFDADGGGSPLEFLAEWRAAQGAIEGRGHIVLPTANHDCSRLACGPRTREQLGPAFCFLLTWPTLPAIYYGDEIGMRYIPDLPDREGSRMTAAINRGGSRTPMQWDGSDNAGFSTGPASSLYLPLDPDPGRPDVASQRADESSLLNLVRRLILLRRSTPALGPNGSVEVLHAGYPFVYARGPDHLVVSNPRRDPARATVPAGGWTAVEASGVTVSEGQVRAAGFSYGVFRRN